MNVRSEILDYPSARSAEAWPPSCEDLDRGLELKDAVTLCRLESRRSCDPFRTPLRDQGSSDMAAIPQSIAECLVGRRIAVVGVSRTKGQFANAILLRLLELGYEAVLVNPHAAELEGQPSYPDLASVPGAIDGVMIVTDPEVSGTIVRQAGELGIRRVWFHRAFGVGSVSEDALAACRTAGIDPIVRGCPLIYLDPDIPHRFFRWVLELQGSMPR
jgi:predicted CoA-binding protein